MRAYRVAARIVGSRRGIRVLAADLLVAFGGVSAVVQFVGQLFPRAFPHPTPILVGSIVVCLSWGMVRARPRHRMRRRFRYPGMSVVVEGGDLFEKQAHLVVGFTDTFDTTVDKHGVINGASVQGQLLDRWYGGDARRLDREIGTALTGAEPMSLETRQSKRRGKLTRYPIGTVAVLGDARRLVFAVAYSRLGNDLVARSSVEEFWFSLNRLWDAVYQRAQHESVAMPLLGAGLARLDFLDEETILRLILLSFVVHSRERSVCRELCVVIRPPLLDRIDLREIGAFLDALGTDTSHR